MTVIDHVPFQSFNVKGIQRYIYRSFLRTPGTDTRYNPLKTDCLHMSRMVENKKHLTPNRDQEMNNCGEDSASSVKESRTYMPYRVIPPARTMNVKRPVSKTAAKTHIASAVYSGENV